MTGFVAEFSSPIDTKKRLKWAIYVDDAYNIKRSGAGIILEGPGYLIIKHALNFEFTTNKNQADYEALIINIILALETGASKLKDKSNSRLVSN